MMRRWQGYLPIAQLDVHLTGGDSSAGHGASLAVSPNGKLLAAAARTSSASKVQGKGVREVPSGMQVWLCMMKLYSSTLKRVHLLTLHYACTLLCRFILTRP